MRLAERRADHAHALAAGDDVIRDEVGEVARDRPPCARRPRSRAPRPATGALTRLTSSSVWPGEHAVEHREREQARVALGDPAEVLDLDAVDAGASASAIASRPSRWHERQERAEHLHVLRADRRGC